MTSADRTWLDGIAVTSIERTVLDLAEVLSGQRLRSALEAAQRRDLLDPAKLNALLARSNGRRGVTPLRHALRDLHDEAPWTQSGMEQRALELVRDADLPEPQTNVLVDGVLVDFYWPEHNLVVELDGYAFHRSRRQFEADRAKDTRHALAGRRSARFTHARVYGEPERFQRDLIGLLGGGQTGRSDR
jgi:very-short-patch-repair endonuclease